MTTYLLQVEKALPLLQKVIHTIGAGGRCSFEGDLSKIDLDDVHGIVRRSGPGASSTVIIPLNAETISQILPDLLNRIGLRKNVLHIEIEKEGKLLFAAYDQFDEDCVWISEVVGIEFLESLKRDGVITEYKLNPYGAA
jgi:hypothetical protein